MKLSITGRVDLQTRYEQLRQKRLQGDGGYGMNVFLQEGMCGWIHAWRDYVPLDDGENRYPYEMPKEKGPSQMDINKASQSMNALVGFIVSMTLSKIKGV